MAGPTAAILVPERLTDDVLDDIRAELDRVAERREGNNFWIELRPFIVSFGEEYEGELAELANDGLPSVLGWTPADTFFFAAMRNDSVDHALLGQLCVRFARKLGGVIDFGGKVWPEPSLDGTAHVEAVRVERPSGLDGVLFAASYFSESGRYGTCHYGDSTLLEAWLKQPNFRMVK